MSLSVGDSIRVKWEAGAQIADGNGDTVTDAAERTINPWLVGASTEAMFWIHAPGTVYGDDTKRAVLGIPNTDYWERVTPETDITDNAEFEATYGAIEEIEYDVKGDVAVSHDNDNRIDGVHISEADYDAAILINGPPPSLDSDINVVIPGCDVTTWKVTGFEYREKRGAYRKTKIHLVRNPA